MQYSLNELRQRIFSKVNDVYEVFQNYFGEEFTDLQNIPTDENLLSTMEAWDITESEHEGIYEGDTYNWNRVVSDYRTLKPVIIVWWPEVTVTNENNKSVRIKDLYAKIEITMEGTIPMENHGFQLNRTTFTRMQAASGYIHSHLPTHSHWEHVPEYSNPCLGRGPIRNTIVSLKTDSSIEMWMLFCNELALYVTVESLAGGPYIKMENIGKTSRKIGYDGFDIEPSLPSRLYGNNEEKETLSKDIMEFTKYYLKHGHFILCYTESRFCTAMSYYDYMVDISASFIEWFNLYRKASDVSRLFSNDILIETCIREGEFYNAQKISRSNMDRYNGQYVLEFKGERKNLLIEDSNNDDEEQNVSLVLNHKLAMFILCSILRIINYRFTNGNTEQQGSTESSSTNQTAYYI